MSESEKLNGLIDRVAKMKKATRTVSDFVIESMCDGDYNDGRIGAMERYVDELLTNASQHTYKGRTDSERVELLRNSIGEAMTHLTNNGEAEALDILRWAWTEDWPG